MNLIKHSGQVFTPTYIVDNMLDFCGYNSTDVLKKHIIDNSCGDGAFLCVVVARYCNIYTTISSDLSALKQDLEEYIHGIEIDSIAYQNCIFNLSAVVKEYGITDVNWDINQTDALIVTKYNNMMDFVVGNPPYVRVHNLEKNYDTVKTFHFANGGMTDLYLVFYELGFRMLNSSGKLCYITPSSWLNSLAATNLRDYILRKRTLVGLIDFGHFQPFEGITTYTIISLFDNSQTRNNFSYYVYDEIKHNAFFINELSYSDITIGKNFYISSTKDIIELKKIKLSLSRNYCTVKNGFATLSDNVFIGDNIPFDDFTIPVIKASTGKWYKAFFPYNKNGKPLSKETLFSISAVSQYLNKQKEVLLKGRNEVQNPNWYLYGRTQALKDVYENKISINTIIRDVDSIKLYNVPIGSGLYSGLYILTRVSFSIIESIIKSEEFINYIKTLKNYKSGGYYTFNSKDLEQYLNYKLSNYARSKKYIPIDKCGVSQGCLELF